MGIYINRILQNSFSYTGPLLLSTDDSIATIPLYLILYVVRSLEDSNIGSQFGNSFHMPCDLYYLLITYSSDSLTDSVCCMVSEDSNIGSQFG